MGNASSRFRAAPLSPTLVVKRAIDIVGAGAGLVMLSPILAILAGLVRVRLGSPVLFVQVRTGLDGRLFRIYKFRSMTDERDATGDLLPDDQRMTAFGRLLRSTSLDELPELFNVCRGEMSLVGPRPLLPEYLDRYSERQRRRHGVRPGITGWCQINGRNSLSWEEKFELDVWYVEHRTLILDLRILAATLSAVLTRRGINAADDATMPKFQGTEAPPGQPSGC
jgi:lipopolysaccharide/colanic/teichoic acid biosynthesis glycosyltransferase